MSIRLSHVTKSVARVSPFIILIFGLIVASYSSVQFQGWQGSAETRRVTFCFVLYFTLMFLSLKGNNNSLNLLKLLVITGTMPAIVYILHIEIFIAGVVPFLVVLILGSKVMKFFNIRSFAGFMPAGAVVLEATLHIISFLGLLNAPVIILFSVLVCLWGFFPIKRKYSNVVKNFRKTLLNLSNTSILSTSAISTLVLMGSICSVSPDLLFDSNNLKAWMPKFWKQIGSIEIATYHPQSGQNGSLNFLQLVSNYFGSWQTGAVIQLLSLLWVGFAIIAIKEISLIPKLSCILLLFSVPAISWQFSGGYDDVWLMAITLSTFLAARDFLEKARLNSSYFCLGLLLAAILNAKISLIFLAVTPLLALIFYEVVYQNAIPIRRLALLLFGFFMGGSWQFLWKFSETGNPLWPNFNAIFHGRFLPHENIKWGMPFGPSDIGSILWMPIESIFHPGKWVEALAAGTYGSVLLFVIFTIFTTTSVYSFKRETNRPTLSVLGITLIVGLIFWAYTFRYLRYLFPIYGLSVLAYLLSRNGLSQLKGSLNSFLVLILSISSIISFPVGNPAVAERIPLAFAMKQISEEQYLKKYQWNFELIQWLNNTNVQNGYVLASPTAIYQRSRLREGLDYIYDWELAGIADPPRFNFIVVDPKNSSKDILEFVKSNKATYLKSIDGMDVYECN